MALSSIEKKILINKYIKDGLNYDQIKNRMNELITSINKIKRSKKEEKDFNQEFKKLWDSGRY